MASGFWHLRVRASATLGEGSSLSRPAHISPAQWLSTRCGGPASRVWAFVCAGVLSAIACSGSQYRAGVYEDGDARYSLQAPGSEWSRLELAGQNDLAWRNDSLAAIIQTNASCNPSQDIPLVALTNHLLIGFTEREVATQDLVSLDGREALRTHVRAKLDGVTRELLLVVLKKDGCVYDFALVAPPASFSGARSTYETMLGSFGTRP